MSDTSSIAARKRDAVTPARVALDLLAHVDGVDQLAGALAARTARRAATARQGAARGRASPCAHAVRPRRLASCPSRSRRRRSLAPASSSSRCRRSSACAPALRPRRPRDIEQPCDRAALVAAVGERRATKRAPRPRSRSPLAREPAPRHAPVAERKARARARSLGRRTCSRCAIRSGGSASKRTCWQREATVASTSSRRSVSSSRCTNDGGSSSVLSIRLAAWSFIACTPSSTNTRRAASNGVRVAAATTGLDRCRRRAFPPRRSARPRSRRGGCRAISAGTRASISPAARRAAPRRTHARRRACRCPAGP